MKERIARLMEPGKGIPEERIRKYGFAFRGKEVLIGAADETINGQ